MNVLFVLPSLARAGAEMQTVDLVNGLSERRHGIHLFIFDPPYDLQDNLSSAVTLHRVNRRSKLDRSVIRQLTDVLDQNDIQSIVAVNEYSLLYAWLGRRKSRRKPPIVASLHSVVPPNFKLALQARSIYRWLLKRIEHVVFVCKSQREKRLESLPWLRVISSVIYNGIDYTRFQAADYRASGLTVRASLGIPSDAFVFSCIAQFRPEKRHTLLAEAFARLEGHAYLLLAGDGPCRAETADLVSKLALEDRVFFLGNVENSREVIAASNATVLASKMEAFSMAMLESLALGVPMVAPRVGGLPEAVIDGETGRLFSTGNVDGLCECMQYMMDHPEHVAEMGECGTELVRERFSRENMISMTEKLLQNLTSQYLDTPS